MSNPPGQKFFLPRRPDLKTFLRVGRPGWAASLIGWGESIRARALVAARDVAVRGVTVRVTAVRGVAMLGVAVWDTVVPDVAIRDTAVPDVALRVIALGARRRLGDVVPLEARASALQGQ